MAKHENRFHLRARSDGSHSAVRQMNRPSDGDVLGTAGMNRLIRGRDGWFLYNKNDAYIGRALETYGEYCQAEAEMLLQLVRPGDCVVEVGANIGSHTVGLADAVGPRGKVIAIEPQRVVHQLLCANMALNSIVWADCVHAAAGNASGMVRIPEVDYAHEGNFGGLSIGQVNQGYPVPLIALDAALNVPQLRLLKVDVEGMEQAVLEGAAGLIQQFQPILYVENDRLDRSEALIRTIDAMHYDCYWHLPYLFNPQNWFGAAVNLFPGTVSCNMLCISKNAPANISGLPKITDPAQHPLRPAA